MSAILLAFAVAASAAAVEIRYVAARSTRTIYHRSSDCRSALNIKPANLVKLGEGAEAQAFAKSEGLRLCKECAAYVAKLAPKKDGAK